MLAGWVQDGAPPPAVSPVEQARPSEAGMADVQLVRDASGRPIAQFTNFVAFENWTHAELTALRGLGTLERYPKGAVLAEPGHEDDRALFIVVGGEFEVVRGGQQRGIQHAGDLVGELAFVDGLPRTAIIRARANAVVLRIRPDDVERFAVRDHVIVLKFLREMTRILSFRLRTAWS